MLDTIIPTVQMRKLRPKKFKQLWSQDLKPSSVAPEPTIQTSVLHFQNIDRTVLTTFTMVIQSGRFFPGSDFFSK